MLLTVRLVIAVFAPADIGMVRLLPALMPSFTVARRVPPEPCAQSAGHITVGFEPL